MVLGAAVLNNDGGAIWVEGNSMPLINYNWVVGNFCERDPRPGRHRARTHSGQGV